MSKAYYMELALGALFVFVHFYERFNTPVNSRSCTTATRYYAAVGTYTCIALLTYFVLSYYPGMLKNVISGADLKSPLLAALALSLLTEKRAPVFSRIDKWVRDNLQYMAAIPDEQRRLSAQLRNCGFDVSRSSCERVAEKLVDLGFQGKDMRFAADRTPQYLITKIAVIMDGLARWETEPRYSGFLATASNELQGIKQKHDQLARKALRCLRLCDETFPSTVGYKSIEALLFDLKEQANELFVSLCDFVARAVLHCCVSQGVRSGELRKIGFVEGHKRSLPGVSVNQVCSLFVWMATILLLVALLAKFQQWSSLKEGILRTLMIAAIHSMAIVCALYPKGQWAVARRGARGERPTLFYLLAGAMALAVGVAINIAFKWMIYEFNFDKTLNDFRTAYPWVGLSFVLAAMLALEADNVPTRLGRFQRWTEGLALAAVMGLAWFVVWRWLLNTGYKTADDPKFFLWVMGLSVANGFVLGYVVPSWYRRACSDVVVIDEDIEDGSSSSLFTERELLSLQAVPHAEDQRPRARTKEESDVVL
jgi:hypothetical protein